MSYNEGEFSDLSPIPRNGLTSIEAEHLIRTAFPEVESWLCWEPPPRLGTWGISKIPVATHNKGRIGKWSWDAVSTDYPRLDYCFDNPGLALSLRYWTGAIRVHDKSGQDFMLFSFLSSRGTVGELYLASTHDVAVLTQFAEDAAEKFDVCDPGIKVTTIPPTDDIILAPEDEDILLPPELLIDIELQVDQFFGNPGLFDALNIPRRRGFLFVGPPGNGKTLATRNIIRRAWRRFGAKATMLTPSKDTDEGDVRIAFKQACSNGPGILVLEDIDSLTTECKLTRAALLSMLDGLRPKESVLVLASTNNPEDIDPALVHRPSRFDRVWHFDLPTEALRIEFLQKAFSSSEKSLISETAKLTCNWSFAYLNELRVTAAILALCDGGTPAERQIRLAYTTLSEQFQAGVKNHKHPLTEPSVGFRAA